MERESEPYVCPFLVVPPSQVPTGRCVWKSWASGRARGPDSPTPKSVLHSLFKGQKEPNIHFFPTLHQRSPCLHFSVLRDIWTIFTVLPLVPPHIHLTLTSPLAFLRSGSLDRTSRVLVPLECSLNLHRLHFPSFWGRSLGYTLAPSPRSSLSSHPFLGSSNTQSKVLLIFFQCACLAVKLCYILYKNLFERIYS